MFEGSNKVGIKSGMSYQLKCAMIYCIIDIAYRVHVSTLSFSREYAGFLGIIASVDSVYQASGQFSSVK